MATTVIALENSTAGEFDLVINTREGSFDGRVKDENSKPSDPVIPGVGEISGFQARIFGGAKEVTLNDAPVAIREEDGYCVFDVPQELHAAGKLVYHVIQ